MKKKKKKSFDLNYDNNVMEKNDQRYCKHESVFHLKCAYEISRCMCSSGSDKNKSSHSQLEERMGREAW